MVLHLEALDQMLTREVVLMECVRTVCMAWGLESPFDEGTIALVREAQGQVVKMLRNGITELRVPENPG